MARARTGQRPPDYLWEHQRGALGMVRRYMTAHANGAALVRMPTGTGKTAVMATLSQLVPSIARTLIVAPWSQLTEQLAREIDERFWTKVGVPPARIRKAAACFTPATLASHLDAADAPEILICTNQTLERLHSSYVQEHQRLAARTTLVMVDEGHREPAPRWATAVRALAKPTVLFSATPYRNDHRLFHIDPDHIYRFPHDEAVSERFIRDVRFEEFDWGHGAAPFARALQRFVNQQVIPHPPAGYPSPRVIVRCATREDVQAVTAELQALGEDVIGIHETFDPDTGHNVVRNVPDPATTTARYWVHQFKLLEGVDDPAFCVVAIYQPFGTARALVQQIGRVVRNPARAAHQRAWVFTTPRHRQKAMWDAYLKYEEQLDSDAPSDPQGVLHEVLRVTERLDYVDGHYRAQFDPATPDIHTQFAFPLAANVLVAERGFTMDDLASSMEQMIDEEDLVLSGQSSPDTDCRFMAYAKFHSSELLIDRTFPELLLGFCVAKKRGSHVFFYDTLGMVPDYLRTHTSRVNPEHLERLLSATESRISNVSLLNSDLSVYSVRRRTMSARSIDALAPGLADHAHFCSTATGLVTRNGGGVARRYVGFTRSRVSESRTHHVEFGEFDAWTREIDQGLQDVARTAPELFSRYALFAPTPNNPVATSILLDLEEVDALDLEHRTSRDAAPTPVRFDDLCWEVTNDVFEAVAGPLRCPATLRFDANKGEYEIVSRVLDQISLRSNAVRDTRRNLLRLLNQHQAFRIVTGDGHVYAHGKFYKARIPLWGRARNDRIDLGSILTARPSLRQITSEKGANVAPGGAGWSVGSLFELIDRRSNTGLFALEGMQPDYLVCDDLGNELADFIAFDKDPKRVVLVHAKVASTNSNVSASAFHDVCGQAIKNLDLLVPQCDREPKDLRVFSRSWTHRDIGTVTSRTRINADGYAPSAAWKEFQRLVRHPETLREVWIVMGSGLSLGEFEIERRRDRPRGQVIQLIYLLQGTWNAVSATGARLRVFVRP